MTRYIQGIDRDQVTLLPECLDDFIGEDNPEIWTTISSDRLTSGAGGPPSADLSAVQAEQIEGPPNRVIHEVIKVARL